MQAIVTKSTGSWYVVKTDDGEFLNCRIRGKFRLQGINSTNPIVVGDRVNVVQEEESFIISVLHPRKNHIVRKSVNLSKQTHILASNIDQAILMVTLQSPITSRAFIDRFLVSAKAYHINVLILFNKIDLLDKEAKQEMNQIFYLYQGLGYSCHSYSILNDDLEPVKKIMKNKVNVICGHSGVGKSTLLNMLQPELDIVTKEISMHHQQGMHTTTFSEMYQLDFGASIIDTPGVRGFGLVDIDKYELANYFPEFFKLKSQCKFHNCIHINEPNCAVKEALANERIALSRYNNYLNMLEQQDEKYRVNKYDS